MKDEKKKPDLPPQPQPQPQTEPQAVSKERRAPSEPLQNLTAGAESPAAAHATLLGDAGAALPANAEPLAEMMQQLQHNLGNTYVQQVVSEMDTAQTPAMQPRKTPEPSARARHTHVITPTPLQGTINAAGRFTVTYVYRRSADANALPLILSVSAGVSVTANPLTEMNPDAFRIHDPGGTGSRAVTVAVSLYQLTAPNIKVAFMQGNFTYKVIFQFLPEYLPSLARDPKKTAKRKEMSHERTAPR